MSISVVVTPVVMTRSSLSLMVQVDIVLNIMSKITLPVMAVVSPWNQRGLFMIVSSVMFVIDLVMRIAWVVGHLVLIGILDKIVLFARINNTEVDWMLLVLNFVMLLNWVSMMWLGHSVKSVMQEERSSCWVLEWAVKVRTLVLSLWDCVSSLKKFPLFSLLMGLSVGMG